MAEICPNVNYSGAIRQVEDCMHSVFNKGVKYGRYLERLKHKNGSWELAETPLGLVWECDCCKKKFFNKSNFCPDCGAYMRGEEDAD